MQERPPAPARPQEKYDNSVYDRFVSTYSPDGRVLQLEYATRSLYNGGTVIGVKCLDGIILGAERGLVSTLMTCCGNHRLFSVHHHCGMAVAGLPADGRQIVARARYEAASFASMYGERIPCKELAERVASFMHLYTLYGKSRPFGCGVILGGADRDGPQLYAIYPSGSCHRYFAAALGYGKETAIEQFKQYKFSEMTCREGVWKLAIILEIARREEDIDMELSWVCEESNMEFCPVPEPLRSHAIQDSEGAGTYISDLDTDSSSSEIGSIRFDPDASGEDFDGIISQEDIACSDDYHTDADDAQPP